MFSVLAISNKCLKTFFLSTWKQSPEHVAINLHVFLHGSWISPRDAAEIPRLPRTPDVAFPFQNRKCFAVSNSCCPLRWRTFQLWKIRFPPRVLVDANQLLENRRQRIMIWLNRILNDYHDVCFELFQTYHHCLQTFCSVKLLHYLLSD